MVKDSKAIRQRFLDFFGQRGHEIVPSSSLVPASDPTLLFTNAGMVQFKDVFLGREQRDCPRAASSQCCIRAGGKHNDLENVGYTMRHHTFFEMLGNFSFGDYFKEDAIAYAWEFITGEAALPAERLWVTVFEEDREAERVWLEHIGVAPERVVRIGADDNFWVMGDVGPCGPCTEIFYDHGAGVPGGPPGSDDAHGDRYVEIWNLVFMQYERDKQGKMAPLPKPSVDTGMGLERITAIMQGVHSNYDTDLFQSLIHSAAELTGCDDTESSSLKVIADHIRACSFLIAEGIRPENEGRGYVLRRIIRRAARHGHRLGLHEPFFHRLVEPLRQIMGTAYPVLDDLRIPAVLEKEEEQFADTLKIGLDILEDELSNSSAGVIPGDLVFKLYDTYGFPVDLTADIAREKRLRLDMEGFEKLMRQQQRRARDAHHFVMKNNETLNVESGGRFSGYETTDKQAVVRQIFIDGTAAEVAEQGCEAVVILDDTPFYAESGGQVGDTGVLVGSSTRFNVDDTQKQGDTHKHTGIVEQGRLAVGDRVDAQVDAARRTRIMLNHSATHLLHAALKRVLGEHVNQKGSLVAPDRLRFDFSHDHPVNKNELCEIEELINRQIRDNVETTAEIMSKKEALKCGAAALFGEKYGEQVRVLTMGDFSMELCGGTHVARTGDIGVFKIIAETGIAAGVRRVEALTGETAYRYLSAIADSFDEIRDLLQVSGEELSGKLKQLIKDNKRLKKQSSKTSESQDIRETSRNLKAQAQNIKGVQVLAVKIESGDRHLLRAILDGLKNELKEAAIVLAAVNDGKVHLTAGVTDGLTARIKAGELVNFVAQQVGGKGGGRAGMAEAGGNNPTMLDTALDSVPEWVRSQA